MNQIDYEHAKRMMEADLDGRIKAKEAVTSRVKELEEIVAISIAALQDGSPTLASVLMSKAESIFGKKPTA